MHKIDSPGATDTGEFTEGNPSTGTPATVVSADWLNAVQGELVALVEDLGGELDPEANDQIATLIQSFFVQAAGSHLTKWLRLTGVLKPSEIKANQNNYDPEGLADAAIVQLTSDAARTITGLSGGADGRVLMLSNIGSHTITLVNQSNSSSAANRFSFGADIPIAPNRTAILIYDGTLSRWRSIVAIDDLANYLALSGGTLTGPVVFERGNDNTIIVRDTRNTNNAVVTPIRLEGGDGSGNDITVRFVLDGANGLKRFDINFASGGSEFLFNRDGRLTLGADGSGNLDAVTRQQLANYLQLTGGTLTGTLSSLFSDNTTSRVVNWRLWRGDASGTEGRFLTRGDAANGVDQIEVELRHPIGPVRRYWTFDFSSGDFLLYNATPTTSLAAASKGYVDAVTLGWGQTWQDVTGSRSANTAYQNTTGKPISVSVFVGAIGATRALEVSADNSNWVEVANTTTGGGNMQAIVPPGHYYRMNGGFHLWREFR